ncbi:PadR family transcriptional regulator [Glycomyces sp. A-F 0318]|uniref:helix-turn-helix transcriptional regulator n=1 Tax=Glycomyces amatae TaxID=2881355 RepID=UPI001E586278|nr:helix-turn-helix transcriptional regulator [Glycomyces amatae]MCD0445948.1 PadR family transcriptional regulator [Glycomyces amatae]
MTGKPPFRVTPATLDVLEVLLSDEQDLYGLRIAKILDRSSGSIALILMRLENHGWATSRWEPDSEETRLGRPRRRFYELHGDQVHAARALIASRRPAAAPGGRPGRLGLAQLIMTRLGGAWGR